MEDFLPYFPGVEISGKMCAIGSTNIFQQWKLVGKCVRTSYILSQNLIGAKSLILMHEKTLDYINSF